MKESLAVMLSEEESDKLDFSPNPTHRPSIPKQCHHPNLRSFTAFKPYPLFFRG